MAIRAAIGVCSVVLICGGCKSHRKAQASVSAILMEDESHKDRILSGLTTPIKANNLPLFRENYRKMRYVPTTCSAPTTRS